MGSENRWERVRKIKDFERGSDINGLCSKRLSIGLRENLTKNLN